MEDISLMPALWENRARPEFFRGRRLELTESQMAEVSAGSFSKEGFSPTPCPLWLPRVGQSDRPGCAPAPLSPLHEKHE